MTQTEGGSRSKERRRTNLSFAQFPYQLHQRFREKPAIVSVHRISCDHHCSLSPHAYFAEQLSLRLCAVRYRACGQDRELQSRREASAHIGGRCVQIVKAHAAPGELNDPASRHDNDVQVDDNFFLLVPAASALLTKCNSLPMPRFRQTCGRKCRTPCGGRSANRGLLNNSQIIMIRRMAQRNPSQTRQPGISKPRR
jgi:hypothetical protein